MNNRALQSSVKVRSHIGDELTILKLNSDSFVRTFHQEPTRSKESVWSFESEPCKVELSLCHKKARF